MMARAGAGEEEEEEEATQLGQTAVVVGPMVAVA